MFFLNWAFPGLFFLYSRLFNTVDGTYKFCRWLDSNRGPLVSEATALPTVPQPLSHLIEYVTLVQHIVIVFDQSIVIKTMKHSHLLVALGLSSESLPKLHAVDGIGTLGLVDANRLTSFSTLDASTSERSGIPIFARSDKCQRRILKIIVISTGFETPCLKFGTEGWELFCLNLVNLADTFAFKSTLTSKLSTNGKQW